MKIIKKVRHAFNFSERNALNADGIANKANPNKNAHIGGLIRIYTVCLNLYSGPTNSVTLGSTSTANTIVEWLMSQKHSRGHSSLIRVLYIKCLS